MNDTVWRKNSTPPMETLQKYRESVENRVAEERLFCSTGLRNIIERLKLIFGSFVTVDVKRNLVSGDEFIKDITLIYRDARITKDNQSVRDFMECVRRVFSPKNTIFERKNKRSNKARYEAFIGEIERRVSDIQRQQSELFVKNSAYFARQFGESGPENTSGKNRDITDYYFIDFTKKPGDAGTSDAPNSSQETKTSRNLQNYPVLYSQTQTTKTVEVTTSIPDDDSLVVRDDIVEDSDTDDTAPEYNMSYSNNNWTSESEYSSTPISDSPVSGVETLSDTELGDTSEFRPDRTVKEKEPSYGDLSKDIGPGTDELTFIEEHEDDGEPSSWDESLDLGGPVLSVDEENPDLIFVEQQS